jgi:hypothetical protein
MPPVVALIYFIIDRFQASERSLEVANPAAQ